MICVRGKGCCSYPKHIIYLRAFLENFCIQNRVCEMIRSDKIIIGAGLYGLYAALLCAKRGEHVVVLECDDEAFGRATYINQARVHQGYHYPRSLSTAKKSAGYFERFNRDFGFCINSSFEKVYATSNEFSWTNGRQFLEFCRAAGIPCQEVMPDGYFKSGLCDGAFLTQEYTYDAHVLRDYYLEKLGEYPELVQIRYGICIQYIEEINDEYVVCTENNVKYASGFILNATYASTNQIAKMLGYDLFKIKYELCEIILCEALGKLKDYGITVMDGPFFSIMPFGLTGFHSLTAVSFTPHTTSYEEVPYFSCQNDSEGYCSALRLGNCNACACKPATAFSYMGALARKYLKKEFDFSYQKSLFSMKPILMSSEIDDSRPTVIKVLHNTPRFVSVLSGKINTVYDLDEVL